MKKYISLLVALLFASQVNAEIFYTPASGSGGGGGGVTSINSITGAVTLAAGSNITLTPSGSTITIASTGGGSSAFNSITSGTNTTAAMVVGSGATFTTNDTSFFLQYFNDHTITAQFDLSNLNTGTAYAFRLPQDGGIDSVLASTGNIGQVFAGSTTFSNTFSATGTSFSASGTTINIGASTNAGTYNMGSGNIGNSITKSVNIGTSGQAGSITNIALGGSSSGTQNITLGGTTGTTVLKFAPFTTAGVVTNSSTGVLSTTALTGSGNIVAATSPTITGASVNGVTLTTGGSSTTYLNGAGSYTTPSGGGSPSIGGTITSGVASDILFVNPTATIAQDNAFNYVTSTGVMSVTSASGGYIQANGFAVGASGLTELQLNAGFLGAFGTSYAGVAQVAIVNQSNNAAASSNFVAGNNLDTTGASNYIDMGINSSTYTGSGSLNLANAGYLYAETGDLVLGTGTANGIHIVLNGFTNTVDAASITSAGITTFANSTFTASSGVQDAFSITPTYNQTSTAGATDLLVNRTQTAVGSGTQRLIDLQVGSSTEFNVTNAGVVNVYGAITGNLAATSGIVFISSTLGSGSNFSTTGSTVAASGSGILQFAGSSNINYRTFFGGSTATLAANDNYAGIIVGAVPITEPASGTVSWSANMAINPIGTVTGSGATLTNTTSLLVQGQITTGTNNYAAVIYQGTLNTQGSITAPAWTTNGINFQTAAATYTDSSTAAGSSQTTMAANSFGVPTLTGANGTSGSKVTYTNGVTLYIAGAPTAGTNTVLTNAWAILASGSVDILGNLQTAGTIYNNTTQANSNINVVSSVGDVAQTVSQYQFVGTTNSNLRTALGGSSASTINIGNNYANTLIVASPLTTPASGTNAWLVNIAIDPIGTVTAGGSAITNTSSVYIAGASTAGTNNYAEYIASGAWYGGGSMAAPNLSTSSAATTGTLCWTTATGNFTVDTTTTCLASLEELKNIKAGGINNALDMVNKINPFWFTWKESTPEWAGDKHEQPGMGAHQLEAIDKRLVAYTPDGQLKGVRYQEMSAVLVAAVKEQQEEITELKAKIANDNHSDYHKCFFNLLICAN